MPKKILLADDSITIQKVIQITFATEDYELTVVSEGDSAIRKARELRPDLIMADVAMPGKNGYEVCEAVKNDPIIKNTPVMLLAGTFEPLDKDEAAKVKADDSIVKPFESQELIDKVRDLLAKAAPAAPSSRAVEAAPAAEALEEPWSGGEFLGFSEELEKKDEIKGAPAEEPDLGLLGGEGFFEEAPKEFSAHQDHGFFDLDLKEEEPKAAAPSTAAPKAGEEPAPQEEMPETVGFDLSSFEPEPFKAEPLELEHFGMEEEPVKGPEPPRNAPAKSSPPAAEQPKAAPQAQEMPRIAELETMETPWGAKTEAAVSEAEWQPEETELIEAPLGAVNQERKEEAFEIEEPWTVEEHEAQAKPQPPAQKAPEKPQPALRVVERAAEKTVERVKEEVPLRAASIGIPKEELQAMVEKIAREVIEGIAWEVVPDLAQELLEVEMRKFRETWSKIK